jgi:hypothetical protein
MENLAPAPTHYVWEVAGKSIAVHLDFGVVDRLAIDVMRGFGAVPKRGAEVGGILLGSYAESGGKTIVKVEDFEPVVCDYLRGPSYLLTEKDELRFAAAADRVKTREWMPVGFYRSHTRDGLGLTNEDLALFERYFGKSHHVILLVRPFATKTSVAGFFFQEGDELRRESSYLEFPFRRKDLGGGNSPVLRSFAAETSNAAVDRAEAPETDVRDWVKVKRMESVKQTALTATEPPALVSRSENSTAKFRSPWVWAPLTLVFLIIGVVVGFQGAMMLNRQDVDRALKRSVSLGLTTAWENGRIAVRWDRESAPVQDAQSGFLRILDGEYSKAVTLDERQLRNGIVLYMSTDNRVSFRLEVKTRQGTQIIETTDYIPARR